MTQPSLPRSAGSAGTDLQRRMVALQRLQARWDDEGAPAQAVLHRAQEPAPQRRVGRCPLVVPPRLQALQRHHPALEVGAGG
ncbi:MAG: hypothetical protein EOO24_29050, partial [Comamonadaceae bacterium]